MVTKEGDGDDDEDEDEDDEGQVIVENYTFYSSQDAMAINCRADVCAAKRASVLIDCCNSLCITGTFDTVVHFSRLFLALLYAD